MATSRHDVVIIGGGPGGCVAAAALARAGRDVLLLEAGEHPRPHVGESLLPGIIPILDQIGALEAVDAAGFWPKTGSTHHCWGKTPRWDLWFADSDAYEHAWFVDRSRFDALLFEHAGQHGAQVRARSVAHSALFEDGRVAGVRWRRRDHPTEHVARAAWVIDASGRSGLLGRAIEPAGRTPIAGLQHQASWAHFEHAGRLPPPRQHQAWFLAQPHQWWWCFPLSDSRCSVGVVQLDAAGRRGPPRRDFDAELRQCSELAEVLGPTARRCTPVRHERDWSYRCETIAGPGWLAVGDAAGFIDPVLSTGVMLAMHSGWHAAQTIDAVLGGAAQGPALEGYSKGHHETFEDLIRLVVFYYRQNLHRDEYFWESKRILAEQGDTRARPQKAFVLLTSGLFGNLALEQTRDEQLRRREALTQDEARPNVSAGVRDFICIHLRHEDDPPPAGRIRVSVPVRGSPLYFLIEPASANPGAPALFRTATLHLNALTPRHGNDPISDPRFAPLLRQLFAAVAPADDPPASSLSEFWSRAAPKLQQALERLPGGFELVRIFGH